jgi:hypothetical protein
VSFATARADSGPGIITCSFFTSGRRSDLSFGCDAGMADAPLTPGALQPLV